MYYNGGMKLIFAQGNPGPQYEHTRHNTGFLLIDAVATHFQASWKASTKFNAELAEADIDGQKVLFAKPHSYYNETGGVARQLIDFYKLDPSQDLLVIHDDLALPLGTIRIRQQGSDAGNNGIKSLSAHVGQHYWRIRVGIWNELRDRMDDADFVLSRLTKAEHEHITRDTAPHIVEVVRQFLQHNLAASSTTLP